MPCNSCIRSAYSWFRNSSQWNWWSSVVSIVGVVYVGYEVGLVSAIIIIKTLLTCQMPNVHGVQTNCGHLPYLFD